MAFPARAVSELPERAKKGGGRTPLRHSSWPFFSCRPFLQDIRTRIRPTIGLGGKRELPAAARSSWISSMRSACVFTAHCLLPNTTTTPVPFLLPKKGTQVVEIGKTGIINADGNKKPKTENPIEERLVSLYTALVSPIIPETVPSSRVREVCVSRLCSIMNPLIVQLHQPVLTVLSRIVSGHLSTPSLQSS